MFDSWIVVILLFVVLPAMVASYAFKRMSALRKGMDRMHGDRKDAEN
jgi:hypothetical protein